MKMANVSSALEFLSTKAKVIHGDLSINNILINRVWNYEPGCSPSQLRHLSTSKADTAPDVSDLGFYNDSMSQSGSGSNAGDVVQSPDIDISAPVVQGPTPALVVNTSATTVDYGGTSEFIESAGMVIDCDFMRFLGQTTHQTSVRNDVIDIVKHFINILLGNAALYGHTGLDVDFQKAIHT